MKRSVVNKNSKYAHTKKKGLSRISHGLISEVAALD